VLVLETFDDFELMDIEVEDKVYSLRAAICVFFLYFSVLLVLLGFFFLFFLFFFPLLRTRTFFRLSDHHHHHPQSLIKIYHCVLVFPIHLGVFSLFSPKMCSARTHKRKEKKKSPEISSGGLVRILRRGGVLSSSGCLGDHRVERKW